MLAQMRNAVTGFLAKALMLFLIITFGVWGIGDVIRGGNSSSALVRVGDNDITQQEFARQMQEVQRNAGDRIPAEILNSDMLRQQVLQRMVEERLIGNAAHDLGIYVGTELVAKLTKRNTLFQNLDGTFNAQAFQAYLRELQLSEAGYRQKLAKDTAREMFLASADLDQFKLPESYIALKSLALAEQRGITLMSVSAGNAAPVEEAELEQFYDQFKEMLYMNPEYRTLSYAVISKASIANATKDDTSGQAMEELGYAVDDAIAAGSSMDIALKDAKLDAQTKTLRKITEADGVTPLEKAAIAEGFKLGEGETSGLLSAADGTYFMVSVESVNSARPKDFALVKEDVSKRYRQQKDATLAKDAANALKTALSAEEDTAKKLAIAKEKGAALREISRISRPDAESSKEIPAALQGAVFSASIGDIVGPVSLPNGAYGLALVTGIHVPQTAQMPDAKTQKAMVGQLQNDIGSLWLQSLVKQYSVQQVGAFATAQQE